MPTAGFRPHGVADIVVLEPNRNRGLQGTIALRHELVSSTVRGQGSSAFFLLSYTGGEGRLNLRVSPMSRQSITDVLRGALRARKTRVFAINSIYGYI